MSVVSLEKTEYVADKMEDLVAALESSEISEEMKDSAPEVVVEEAEQEPAAVADPVEDIAVEEISSPERSEIEQ